MRTGKNKLEQLVEVTTGATELNPYQKVNRNRIQCVRHYHTADCA